MLQSNLLNLLPLEAYNLTTGMSTDEIIFAIDAEIARLQHARAMLARLTTDVRIAKPTITTGPERRTMSATTPGVKFRQQCE